MDMELNRKKFIEHVEKNLIVQCEYDGATTIDNDATLEKRKKHLSNIQKMLESEYDLLEEQSLRLKLYKECPGKTEYEFKFQEKDEWKEYEKKRSLLVFESTLKVTQDNIDSYEMQIEVLKTYIE